MKTIFVGNFRIFRIFSFAIFLLPLMTVILTNGCSSGGGSSTTGIGVSPTEIEIQTALSQLSTAFASKNQTETMNSFDSNLRYYRQNNLSPTGYTLEGYTEFQQKVATFFSKVATISISFESQATSPSGDSIATVRTQLLLNYTDLSGTTHNLSEELEIKMEKFSHWGVTEFFRYDKNLGVTGSAFPPSL
jgi:hypothetical protein